MLPYIERAERNINIMQNSTSGVKPNLEPIDHLVWVVKPNGGKFVSD
ncbi:unnamed protein product [Arabidopsis halleri]